MPLTHTGVQQAGATSTHRPLPFQNRRPSSPVTTYHSYPLVRFHRRAV